MIKQKSLTLLHIWYYSSKTLLNLKYLTQNDFWVSNKFDFE